MTSMEVERLWESAFSEVARPSLYLDSAEEVDGFRPLADPQSFSADLPTLSQLQLYATSSNNQLALRQAQDEYLALGRQIAALKGKDPAAKKDPQQLHDHDEFEDRKEATLYGYKYEAQRPALLHNGIPGNRVAEEITEQEKRDVRLFQNPFEQGGFVPTERQYKAMLAKSSNTKNPDGWIPVEKDGKRLIPRQNIERLEYTNVYVKRNVDENGEIIRPTSSGTDDSLATPSKTLENKRLTRTRFGGKKVPPTRDVSEDPSIPSTPGKKRAATPPSEGRDGTPSTKRRRPNGDDRPRHPNQYTKAKELAAAQPGIKAGVNGIRPPSTPAVMPDWSSMTREQLLSRKWTDDELVDSIRKDHAWLHPDPAKSLEWRDKIINGINPVRSWSMVKKWEEWKVTNKDKRPRKKVGIAERDKDETPAPSMPVLAGLGVGMERVGSEGGGERGRRGIRGLAMGLNGDQQTGSRSVDRSLDRSETVTPTQPPRRSMRKR